MHYDGCGYSKPTVVLFPTWGSIAEETFIMTSERHLKALSYLQQFVRYTFNLAIGVSVSLAL